MQNAIESSATLVPKVLTPARFYSSLYLPLVGSLPDLFPLPVCMFQGCIFIQGPKITYNCCVTAFNLFSGVTLLQEINNALY